MVELGMTTLPVVGALDLDALLSWAILFVGTSLCLPAGYLGFRHLALKGEKLHATIVDYYDEVIGPYLGIDGTDLRLVIGIAQFAASVGTLTALWGTRLGIITGDLEDLSNALLLCAMHGMCVICLGGAIIECTLMNKGPALSATLLGVFWAFIYAGRYKFVTPPGQLLTVNLVVFTAFEAACAAGIFATMLTRCCWGKPLDELRELVPDYIQRFDEALGSSRPEPSGKGAPLTK